MLSPFVQKEFGPRDLLTRKERFHDLAAKLICRIPQRPNRWNIITRVKGMSDRRDADFRNFSCPAPEGASISLMGVRIILPFEAEDFDRVAETLVSRFLAASHVAHRQRYDINPYIFNGGSWHLLGYIVNPEDKNWLGGGPCIKARLPRHVRYVEVKIFRALPSMSVLSLELRISESISTDIDRIRHHAPMSPIMFAVSSWTKGPYPYQQCPPDRFRQELLRRYKNALVAFISKYTLKHLSSTHFRNQLNNGEYGCAYLYNTNNVAFSSESRFDLQTSRWLEDNDVESLLPFVTSKPDAAIVFASSGQYKQTIRVNSVFIDSETNLSSQARSYGSFDNFAFHFCSDYIDNIVNAVGALVLVKAIELDLNNMRKRLYHHRGPLINWSDFFFPGRITDTVHRTAMRLDRLSLEIKEEKRHFIMDRGSLNAFSRVWRRKPYPRIEKLGNTLRQSVEQTIESLQKYSVAMKLWHNNLLQAQNIRSNIGLQVVAVLASLVAIGIALRSK